MDFVAEQAQVIGSKKGKGRGKRGGKGKETNTETVQGNKNNTKGRRDPNWSDHETSLFLDLLAEVQSRRQDSHSDGEDNDHEWSYVYNPFNKMNTQMRALMSLKLRWKNVKGDFSFFWHMANRSGCGWNEEAHTPDVPEDAWRNLQEPKKNKMEIDASQVTVIVSDELRCYRTNGSRWHCSEKAMPNSKFCIRHFFPCKSTSSKKK